MRSSIHEIKCLSRAGLLETKQVARPTISSLCFSVRHFEKDPVDFHMWQESCSSTKLNVKAAFFFSFLPEHSVENIVNPCYIFYTFCI